MEYILEEDEEELEEEEEGNNSEEEALLPTKSANRAAVSDPQEETYSAEQIRVLLRQFYPRIGYSISKNVSGSVVDHGFSIPIKTSWEDFLPTLFTRFKITEHYAQANAEFHVSFHSTTKVKNWKVITNNKKWSNEILAELYKNRCASQKQVLNGGPKGKEKGISELIPLLIRVVCCQLLSTLPYC